MLMCFQGMQLLLPLHLLAKPVCLFRLPQPSPLDLGYKGLLGMALLAPTLPAPFTALWEERCLWAGV